MTPFNRYPSEQQIIISVTESRNYNDAEIEDMVKFINEWIKG